MAAAHRYREEQLNIQLADLLASRGLDANAETIVGRNLPDVLISLDGVKLVIEGRIATSRASLFRDAQQRVEDGIADLSMALLYPPALKEAASQEELRRNLASSSYDGAVYYMGRDGMCEQAIQAGSVDDLVGAINMVFGLRIRNDIVRHQVDSLRDALDRVVESAASENLFFKSDAVKMRLRNALGLG